MNKLSILTALCICLLAVQSFSQTSVEEYNYVTKGYKIQMDGGLDMKKGYQMKDVKEWGVDYDNYSRKALFKHLFRDGDTVPCATFMKLYSTNNNYERIICIPHFDSSKEMWDLAYKDFWAAVSSWDVTPKGFAWGMIRMISYQSSQK